MFATTPRKIWTAAVLALLLSAGRGRAEAQTTVSDQAITQELGVLASHAAAIFVGQIVSVQRRAGFVDVTFRVEQRVSGSVGATYTMREWAGLWPMGMARETVGARVLAFVHGASAAGASSPVHGAEGLVPVLVQGADAPRLLDIRRVAASVVRAAGTPLPGGSDGAMLLDAAIASFEQVTAVFTPSRSQLRAHLPAAMQPQPRGGAGVSGQNNLQTLHVSRTGVFSHVAR